MHSRQRAVPLRITRASFGDGFSIASAVKRLAALLLTFAKMVRRNEERAEPRSGAGRSPRGAVLAGAGPASVVAAPTDPSQVDRSDSARARRRRPAVGVSHTRSSHDTGRSRAETA